MLVLQASDNHTFSITLSCPWRNCYISLLDKHNSQINLFLFSSQLQFYIKLQLRNTQQIYFKYQRTEIRSLYIYTSLVLNNSIQSCVNLSLWHFYFFIDIIFPLFPGSLFLFFKICDPTMIYLFMIKFQRKVIKIYC